MKENGYTRDVLKYIFLRHIYLMTIYLKLVKYISFCEEVYNIASSDNLLYCKDIHSHSHLLYVKIKQLLILTVYFISRLSNECLTNHNTAITNNLHTKRGNLLKLPITHIIMNYVLLIANIVFTSHIIFRSCSMISFM